MSPSPEAGRPEVRFEFLPEAAPPPPEQPRPDLWRRRGPAPTPGPAPAPEVIANGPPDAPKRWTPPSKPVLVAAVVVLAMALTGVLAYRWGAAGAQQPAAARPSASPSPTGPPTTAQIYAAILPSIVTIETLEGGRTTGSGTGVVVNEAGAILTAFHVIKGAATIRVTFTDGTAAEAKVVGAEPAMDIALLEPGGLPEVLVPAKLGNSERLTVGAPVVAVGNQLGLTATTTTGVVSGLNRSAESAEGRLTGLIQFDAAVNPGSSGGPLLNGRGETIGIVVALANPTSAGTFVGVGFAVPIGAALAAGAGEGENGAPQQ